MRSYLAPAGALVLAALTGGAPAQTPTAGGYLAGREPDTVAVIPQAPAPGTARDDADRAIFRATRALQGTPRWNLATSDAQLSIPDLLRDFSCAAGAALTVKDAPALAKVIRNSFPDMASAYNPPKDLYKRPRPYLRDPGPICVARSDYLDKSYDYPSGHATIAWATGLILAEAAPDRASAILARARAFGESRAVCGVHSASAVDEARSAASTLVAALDADAAFRTDESAARTELTALRADPSGLDAQACQAEVAITARTPW